MDNGDFDLPAMISKTKNDAPLPRALGDRIVEYLEEFRPRLVRRYANVDWVFPSSRSLGAWDDLSKHVQVLTARLVPETPGIGPHACRHLVVTDYLRKHPNDYPTVAKLLHDNLETVLSEYAHLCFDDAFGRYEEHLGRIGKVGPGEQR
jgi:integrase